MSIHTLSAAAFEILKDLDKKGPKTGTFYDLVDQYVRPEERDAVMKTFKQAQNFFKHADQDPDATLDFSLAEPEMFLLAACDKFRELSGTITAEIETFLTWCKTAEEKRGRMKGFSAESLMEKRVVHQLR